MTSRLTAILTLLLLGVLSSAVQAQTRPSVPPDVDVTFVFNHDGLYTDGYRVVLDGKTLPDFSPAAVLDKAAGEVRIPLGKLTRGPHTLEVGAFNVDGFTKASLPFDVKNPTPGAITNPRVIVITVQVQVQP